MAASLPSNVHVSAHPCLRAKLSQLRSASTGAQDTKRLIHDVATIVGCEALAHGLRVEQVGTVSSLPSSSPGRPRLTCATGQRELMMHSFACF